MRVMPVKLGSAEVVDANGGEARIDRLSELYEQMQWLHSARGVLTLVVSSGAGALGGGKQGQDRLDEAWAEATDGRAQGIHLRDHDLKTKEGRDQHAAQLDKAFRDDLLPVVNGHYDETEGSLVANNDRVLGAETRLLDERYGRPTPSMVALTAAGGVRDVDGLIIPTVDKGTVDHVRRHIDDSAVSQLGSGGMGVKFDAVWGAVAEGATVRGVIASAAEADVLAHVAEWRSIGTTFTLGAVSAQEAVRVNGITF